jgi:sugar transferase (PEP-CTERM system associated)
MFRVFAHHVRGLIIIEALADTLVCFLAILSAGRHMFIDPATTAGTALATAQLLVPAAGSTVVMSLMYSFVGLYRRGAVAVSLRGMFGRALLAVLVGACLAFFALTLAGHQNFAVEFLGRAVLYVSVGVVMVRSVAFFARQASLGARRVLIVGTGPEARIVADSIRSAGQSKATIVGFYATGESADEADTPGRFPATQSIKDIVRENRVDEIIVAVREQRGGGVPMDQLLACRIGGIPVLDMAGFNERVYGEVPVDSLKASWLVYGHGFVQGPLRSTVKRLFDVLGSTLLLVMASPVMLVAMVAIPFESPGAIFYSQERVGRGGRIFKCLKFRSMRSDAEKDGVARWATKNDSRVTRVGSFMRKTRIDELPQLVSVLRGEMSLVGPRPERPSFVEELKKTIPFYDIRHSVKPGVTGWAQVRFGYCATLDDSRRKHQFDLYYVKNNSLFLDLLVVIETVSVVLFREGSQ